VEPHSSRSFTIDEAIFELKTMTACTSQHWHVNTTTTATERQAKAITMEYHKKFKKLDEVFVFASEVVGDGTNAYVNEALEKVLERGMSRAGMEELTILPLINTD
jgi:hypothetical protein